mmetsp:Transcript_16823/g.22567  ORF Transcript_16823/g.22567 Transcript_16823/m.22567 type:complete len:183 (-) Transcript_16823:106-654(-)
MPPSLIKRSTSSKAQKAEISSLEDSIASTISEPISNPTDNDNSKDAKSSNKARFNFSSPCGALKRMLKRRRKSVSKSPDFITEEDRSRLSGGNNTRSQLHKNATASYEAGFDCIENDDYETAQQHFQNALRARLTIYGANHSKVIEVHEAMGHVAVMQGDIEKADYHFNIVQTRRGNVTISA